MSDEKPQVSYYALVHDNPDKPVAIMQLVAGADLKTAVEKTRLAHGWKTVTAKAITPADIPQDRTFRNAWQHDGRRIVHDMTKVRAIHLAHIRNARDAALAQLDKEYMRAHERDDTAMMKNIAQRKQALRDLPSTCGTSMLSTPESVKAHWPQILLDSNIHAPYA